MQRDLMSTVRGMRDILPEHSGAWRYAEDAAADCFHRYGYREIRTPLVENLDLFSRQLGEDTDVVQKEMYSFTDSLNGDPVALRPEATVSTVRAYLAAGLHRNNITRLWYSGAMFRHERPQKGRYRQFHQLGGEALGSSDPSIDAEIIIMLARLWRDFGVADKLRLDINNLGNSEERRDHRRQLIAYFERHEKTLDNDSRRRLHTNPLRILDSKAPATLALIADAPRLADQLGDDSRRHGDAVKEKLAEAGIPFNEVDTLVRGLDYYNLTVFEWSLKDDSRRQNTVCGGGRYDGLAEKIGGIAVPGCGFALGMERLLDLLDAPPSRPNDCYLAVTDAAAEHFAGRIAEQCRDDGLSVWRPIGGGNIGKQIKKADAMRIPVALIIGRDEADGDYVTVKRLRDGKQQQSRRDDVAAQARRLINNG